VLGSCEDCRRIEYCAYVTRIVSLLTTVNTFQTVFNVISVLITTDVWFFVGKTNYVYVDHVVHVNGVRIHL
jgi:hypothetical protein